MRSLVLKYELGISVIGIKISGEGKTEGKLQEEEQDIN